ATGQAPSTTPTTPATPTPAAPTPLAPTAAPPSPGPASGTVTPGTSGTRAKPAPLKTDEKAGTNEALHKNAGYKTVSKADEDCALSNFHDANAVLNNGLFPQAAKRYREALSCWDHPAIHYNLALALINLDQPIEVFDQLNEAIKYGADPLGQDKFDHAKEYLKLVAGQLADIEVTCNKVGAKISVDGKEVFTAPGSYKAKVRVGKHTFYGDKEGYNARVTAPFIGPGETFRIELKLYTAVELTRYSRRWSQTWMPYTVLGAGVLAGLVGGGFEYLANSNFKDFNTAVARCNTTTMGCSSSTSGLLAMRDSGNTKRTIGIVGYGVAGAAIVTGAVLAYLNRSQPYQIRPEDLEEEKTEAATHPVAFTPIVSPELMGAMVQGHF
ncbi:MAG TPA: hypothetical protein VF469_25030, partial [Kofleriaceae bacterium]